MTSFKVVSVDIASDVRSSLLDVVILRQISFLILKAAKPTLNHDVISPATFPVHTLTDTIFSNEINVLLACKLTTLIWIQNLRFCYLKCLFKSMDNHSSIQGMAIKGMVGMEDCCCSQIPVVIECFLMWLCQQHWIEPFNRQPHSQYLISMRKFFSEYSYGFRPGRSCHDAIRQALSYLNEGYEWVIDIGIEQFFDKVNHDKLIQILREQVNDSTTLNLIRKYLKVGVVEKGLEKATIKGVPQGQCHLVKTLSRCIPIRQR